VTGKAQEVFRSGRPQRKGYNTYHPGRTKIPGGRRTG
jgi:hypothetical protein